jgi:hypothetical protein
MIRFFAAQSLNDAILIIGGKGGAIKISVEFNDVHTRSNSVSEILFLLLAFDNDHFNLFGLIPPLGRDRKIIY